MRIQAAKLTLAKKNVAFLRWNGVDEGLANAIDTIISTIGIENVGISIA